MNFKSIFYLQNNKIYKEINENKVEVVFIKKKIQILPQIYEAGNFEIILKMLNILSCRQMKT